MTRPRVLVIDDDDEDILLVRGWLGDFAEVGAAGALDQALVLLSEPGHDAVLLDYRLGAVSGLDVLARIRALAEPPPVLMLTGQGDEETAVEALQNGAVDYLVKSRLTGPELRAAVARAVQLSRAQRDRSAAEQARRRSDERYRRVFDVSLVANAVTTAAGLVTDANAAFARLLGLPAGAGVLLPAHAADPAALMTLLERAAGGEAVDAVPLTLSTARGRDVFVLASLTLVSEVGEEPAVLCAFLDLTASRQLEEQLRISQRMEALGRLAGGIAHDFNNLLMGIQGHAELVLGRLGATDPGRRSLTAIAEAATRGSHLTKQLLAYSRRQGGQPQRLEPDVLLKHLESMVARILGEDVRLTVRRGAPGAVVVVDPVQLEHVLLNLVTNARDAMPGGGSLTITSSVEERAAGPGSKAASSLVVSVADSGSGMTPEVQNRLFEPYFTTKEVGRGSGLGLATALGIVKSAGGTITVDSSPARGTTVDVVLPLAPTVSETIPAAPPASVPGRDRATVLVVEDDDVLRELTTEVLTDLGYTVQAARSGREAEELAARSAPDVVLTDVVLPDGSGPEVASRIKASHPGVRVLFMSGYGAAAAPPGSRLLAKPFTFQDLETAIEQTLAAAR